MRRRTLLATSGVLSTSFVGCLSNRFGSNDDPTSTEPSVPPLEDDDRYETLVSNGAAHVERDLAALVRTRDEIERVVFHDPGEFDTVPGHLTFLRETDYSKHGVFCYVSSFPNLCHELHLDELALESDRIHLTFSRHDTSDGCLLGVEDFVACLRVPLKDEPLPARALIEQRETGNPEESNASQTFTNEFALTLEPVADDQIWDDFPVVDVSNLSDRVRTEVEAALEGRYETINPPWLLAAGRHLAYLETADQVYRPVVTTVGGTADIQYGIQHH